MAERELQRRGKKLDFPSDNENLLILSSNYINLNSEEDAEELVEFVKKEDINIIFIDTLRAVAGGLKEEKAEEVRIFFNRFKSLKDTNCSLVFLDHCRKPQRFEGKVPKKEQLFASQDKAASVECLLMIRNEVNSDDIYFYQRKNRLSKELEPFLVKMEDISEFRTTFVYKGEFEEKETKKEEAKESILTLLEQGGKTTDEIITFVNED